MKLRKCGRQLDRITISVGAPSPNASSRDTLVGFFFFFLLGFMDG